MTSDDHDAAISAAIISMAHSLKLKVIAEGVETEEQLAMLCFLKCDQIQGHLFSKPMMAEHVIDVLNKESTMIKKFLKLGRGVKTTQRHNSSTELQPP
ncbi:MAG: EAL domain-containing protein, partial [Gammaproteobacteria bacterium]